MLAAAVAEGRRTFANTRKYMLLGTSSNFGNMASMAAAALLLPFLPMLPVQILLNNLLYDMAESAALPLDRVEPADARRPQRWDMALLRRFMFVIGPVSSLFDLLTFALLLWCSLRRRRTIPVGLVHRIDGDAGAGDVRHPHARCGAAPAGRIRRCGSWPGRCWPRPCCCPSRRWHRFSAWCCRCPCTQRWAR